MPRPPILDLNGKYILTHNVAIYEASPIGQPPGSPLGNVNCRIWSDLQAARQAIVAGSTLQWSVIMITDTDAFLNDGRDGVYGGLAVQPASHWVRWFPGTAITWYRMILCQKIWHGTPAAQFRTLMQRVLGPTDASQSQDP